ncbi:hypothetical protein ALC57_15089 [Trachymyrmex cornetzi]|uniref:Transposable element Tc3 transposase n=1 Tax=Trachymyrmex cornetzi TaxID=471704 RepID=A0A151IXE4_9HYME|nr:hypothetical protein ALC57_15089 [Trachymyrmex cornetzi]
MHLWSDENPTATRPRSFLIRWKRSVRLQKQNSFSQDGAGPHNARIVTNYLNEQFPRRWMGRYGPIRWPARSPDLNPLDFFLWGYCKEQIYKTLPENIDDLDARLQHAIWAIEENIMENVQANLLKRMRACVRMDGAHFEHLL